MLSDAVNVTAIRVFKMTSHYAGIVKMRQSQKVESGIRKWEETWFMTVEDGDTVHLVGTWVPVMYLVQWPRMLVTPVLAMTQYYNHLMHCMMTSTLIARWVSHRVRSQCYGPCPKSIRHVSP